MMFENSKYCYLFIDWNSEQGVYSFAYDALTEEIRLVGRRKNT